MLVLYTDRFVLPLPANHRFPMSKYSMLRQRVAASGLAIELEEPPPASDDELGAAHSADYLDRVSGGELDPAEVRRIGFPWSEELVERSRRSTGATIQAARRALADGVAVSLAGGTHHAFRDRGEGFCVFNDSVVAARVLQAEGLVRRALVVDCDVHQGNGTAALCATDDSIFTFSVHGAKNFPFRKEASDLDVALDDGTDDDAYIAALEDGFARAIRAARADLVFYVSGADAWHGDRWGRLALTKNGLATRDRLVLNGCRRAGLPVVVTMAGGYAPRIEDTVDIHYRTVETAVSCA